MHKDGKTERKNIKREASSKIDHDTTATCTGKRLDDENHLYLRAKIALGTGNRSESCSFQTKTHTRAGNTGKTNCQKSHTLGKGVHYPQTDPRRHAAASNSQRLQKYYRKEVLFQQTLKP